jgi:RluA family pseudouridine synthase
MPPFDIAARVLLRDANLLILDKPAGLAVHGGPQTPHSLEDLLPQLTFGLRHLPVPGHRLDRDTCGVLVLARHPKAASRLGRLFGAGQVAKTYWAVVEGEPAAESGVIDRPLAKRNDRSGWRMVVAADGQRAVTHWRVLGRGGGRAFLELRPETGRTHQLRVHLADQGWSILGDSVYGGGDGMTTLHLLARRIAIPYWQGRAPVVASAPLSPAQRSAFDGCGWSEAAEARMETS